MRVLPVNQKSLRLSPRTRTSVRKKFATNALGFRMNVHLFYDNEKALKEIGSLYELIDSQEDDLKNMQEPPGWVRWLDLFFHYFFH